MGQAIRAFAKAVAVGTLVGGLPVAFFTIPLAAGDYFQPPSGQASVWAGLYLAMFPFLVAFPLVLVGSTLVGLPAHFLFRRYGLESSMPYVLTGIAGGVLLTLAVLIAIRAEGGFWTCSFGGVSGAITALVWSRSIRQGPTVQPS